MRDGEVGLQPHFTLGSESIRDLSVSLAGSSRETLVALQQCLQEELSVESERRRIEGDGLAVVNECIRPGDGVRDEQVDEVDRRETGISHSAENHVDGILWLGDEAESSGHGCIWATSHELETRGTWAIRNRDRTSELNQITRRDVERLQKGLQIVDSVVNAIVGG